MSFFCGALFASLIYKATGNPILQMVPVAFLFPLFPSRKEITKVLLVPLLYLIAPPLLLILPRIGVSFSGRH